MNSANLYIVSAPSGAGKSSLINALLKKLSPNSLTLSISHTTRNPRPGEVNGTHYHFVDIDTFEKMIQENDFLEYAKVFDNYYGTSLSFINENLKKGIDVFLDIDWQGARLIREKLKNVKSIFILPPSKKELEERLQNRGQDSDEVIAKRMEQASSEISHYNEFDYIIVNDDFDTALSQLETILTAERLKKDIQKFKHQALIDELLK